MVNMNTVNAALWKVQIAKAEKTAFYKRNGLEGSWIATQELAELAYKESTLQNAVNLQKLGMEVSRSGEVEFMANQILSAYPSVS